MQERERGTREKERKRERDERERKCELLCLGKLSTWSELRESQKASREIKK
jgi:hypothetical protein